MKIVGSKLTAAEILFFTLFPLKIVTSTLIYKIFWTYGIKIFSIFINTLFKCFIACHVF